MNLLPQVKPPTIDSPTKHSTKPEPPTDILKRKLDSHHASPSKHPHIHANHASLTSKAKHHTSSSSAGLKSSSTPSSTSIKSTVLNVNKITSKAISENSATPKKHSHTTTSSTEPKKPTLQSINNNSTSSPHKNKSHHDPIKSSNKNVCEETTPNKNATVKSKPSSSSSHVSNASFKPVISEKKTTFTLASAESTPVKKMASSMSELSIQSSSAGGEKFLTNVNSKLNNYIKTLTETTAQNSTKASLSVSTLNSSKQQLQQHQASPAKSSASSNSNSSSSHLGVSSNKENGLVTVKEKNATVINSVEKKGKEKLNTTANGQCMAVSNGVSTKKSKFLDKKCKFSNMLQ